MSKIYILRKDAQEITAYDELYCSIGAFKKSDCVPVDIDEVWHDWSHKWIDCSGEIVKPFPEYLKERIQ